MNGNRALDREARFERARHAEPGDLQQRARVWSDGLRLTELETHRGDVEPVAVRPAELTGTAGDMQLPDAVLGGVFNMGGVAVANYASILERLR